MVKIARKVKVVKSLVEDVERIAGQLLYLD